MHKSRGITRGEVLLIVGLTVLGSAILWFIGWRSKQRLVAQDCATNVRELGEAIAQYSYDHDGYPPPFTNIEAKLAKESHSKSLPTNSSEPEKLKEALRLYVDDPFWFCPADQLAKQDKYYLGIRHQFTSYAFPSYRNAQGEPKLLNQIPTSLRYGLLWDAAGNRQSCEDDLWLGGSGQWASNHSDGYANVVLADLSIHYLRAEDVGKFDP